MKKKTIIILFTWIFSIILGVVLAWRIRLIALDTTGIYKLPVDNWFSFFMNYLPVLTLIVIILTIFSRKKLGLTLSVIALFMSILSFISEFIIFTIRTVDYTSTVPSACMPWLDIPAIFICIILFIIKFKIYTIPREFKFK